MREGGRWPLWIDCILAWVSIENHFWILYVLCVFQFWYRQIWVPLRSLVLVLHSHSLVFILLSEDLPYFLSREWTAMACSLDVRKSASFLNFLFWSCFLSYVFSSRSARLGRFLDSHSAPVRSGSFSLWLWFSCWFMCVSVGIFSLRAFLSWAIDRSAELVTSYDFFSRCFLCAIWAWFPF
jgi:hypothetical protein